jgi:hypothetical protein
LAGSERGASGATAAGEQTERVPLRKPLNLTERAKRLFGFGKVGFKFIRRVTSPTERIIPSTVRLAGVASMLKISEYGSYSRANEWRSQSQKSPIKKQGAAG